MRSMRFKKEFDVLHYSGRHIKGVINNGLHQIVTSLLHQIQDADGHPPITISLTFEQQDAVIALTGEASYSEEAVEFKPVDHYPPSGRPHATERE